MDSVATTGGDAAQLFGVQMDQVTGMEVLAAADRPAGWPIQAGEPVHLVADQHPMHGGGRELHAGGDAGRAEPLASAQPEDALFEPSGGRAGPARGRSDARAVYVP